MKRALVFSALLIVGLLFTQFAWQTSVEGQSDSSDFDQQVNLALRRTAHHLLREAGDSTTRIGAVQQPSPTTFQVRLERAFDYGRLPPLLQQSLAIHAIRNKYDVAVLDCQSGELLLGYSVLDLNGANEVPCVGRNQKQGCYIIQLSFIKSPPGGRSEAGWWPWVAGLALLGGTYLVWQKSGKKANPALQTAPADPTAEVLLQVSRMSFSLANQTLTVADRLHTLTYREAKLLHLFLRHPNQLLERDFILKAVWEDEGIIVGRSVDVFVSRLRKLLQPDSRVRLVAVHGVGYRLEVAA